LLKITILLGVHSKSSAEFKTDVFEAIFLLGSWYDTTHVMGNLLVAEFIVRTLAIVVDYLLSLAE